jgi:DNA helicase-2/ATP-dependent DNA helicase PcrA
MQNFTEKKFLSNLNDKQREAVENTEGPVLIVAGAGAGKTKTITHRILHLIEKGVYPSEILAITFTNKAAKEMRERISHMVAEDTDIKLITLKHGLPFISTFHSLGVFLLKEYGGQIGLSRYFNIFDKNDAKRAIKDALISANYDPKQFDPAKIMHAISKAKGEGVTVSKFKETAGNNFFQRVVLSAWEKYEETLKKENALDFDDLLLKTVVLLEQFENVRNACQERFKYIHIDEYQDTNGVQDRIAEIIAKKHRNICVVGDTDQNIYSWRGANIQNMLNFEKKYPDVKIVRLEENYRSTKTILAVANTIIKKNKYRIEKNLFTNNPHGEKVTLIACYDEAQEAYTIAGKIHSYIEAGIPADEIAILYRANFQSRILEEACVALSVPYQMIGTKFFERKEIKDTLSFIKASLNPASISDIRRIINVPTRGIGKITVDKVLDGKENELSAQAKKKIENFRSILAKIKDASLRLVPSALIKYTIQESGIERELEIGKNDEDTERLENIKELVTLALGYDHYGPEEGIDRLLTDASLATDEEGDVVPEKAVKLMTVHAAKGLEFDHVFITGLEENLFPHKKHDANLSSEDAEEERRLFYVAVTRARKRLYLSYAQMRTIFGSRQVNIPSEFIFDIEDVHMEREEGDADTSPKKPIFRIDF